MRFASSRLPKRLTTPRGDSRGGCDLIYYWEVGSDALNYFFHAACAVQCTSHGSMITTEKKISAVDWFISGELIEPPFPTPTSDR